MPVNPVPARVRPGLTMLARLDDEAFSRLARELESHAPTADLTTMAVESIRASRALSEEDAEQLAGAITSAAVTHDRNGQSAEEFVNALDLEQLEPDDPDVGKRARFRLARLLDGRPLAISTRAMQLAGSDDRVLIASRVITDLRPIFTAAEPDDIDTWSPSAAIIVHLLRLEYYRDGETKTLTLSLDERDIRLLQGALTRATKKAATLIRMIGSVGLPDATATPPE